MTDRNKFRQFALVFIAAAVMASLAIAPLLAQRPARKVPQNPDFTQGGETDGSHDWTLGATGARGWIYAYKHTGDARQILIAKVANGSPADGVLKVDDVILGVEGKSFDDDARIQFARAVMRWPGTIHAGDVNNEIMTAMDLLPTFATLTGAEVPADRTIDGKNIWPTLIGESGTPHEAFFYYRDNSLNAVRSGKWKLHLREGKPVQLCDLETDIGEKQNLIKDHPKVVQRLVGNVRTFEKNIAEDNRPAEFVENPRPLAIAAAVTPPEPVGASTAGETAKTDATKPNFVIIFTDDQGYQDLGCYGSPDIKTPHIDQMAKEGMRFTSFYAQTVCGPSRTSLLTGCYPMRTQRGGHDDGRIPHPALSLNEITIPEILKPLGYHTAMIGKWDLAGRRPTFKVDLHPGNQGFDYSFWTQTSGDGPIREGARVAIQKPVRSTLTTLYTDKAIEFIEQKKDEPFFLYLAHVMPHTKLAVSDAFKGKSDGGFYGDVIEEIDNNVGRILTHIKDSGLDESTYVIFTSDNGPWWREGDHAGHCEPLRSAKTSTYEGGLRVPYIIRAPGKVPGGTTSDVVAATIDLLPTIAKLTGAQLPDDRVIDGLDISEVIHGTKTELDRPFFYYQHQALRAVRQGDWKLHLPHSELDRTNEGKTWQTHVPEDDRPYIEELTLYNLNTDIGEATNVASDHPEVVKSLLQQLDFAKQDIGYHDHVGTNSRRKL